MTPPSTFSVNGDKATFTVTPADQDRLVNAEVYYSFERFLFLIAISPATSLYFVIHEFGHDSARTLLGGTVDRVVWTPLSGEEARVYLDSLPSAALPWMSAGGILVPTALGLTLLGVWAVLSKRLSWCLSAAWPGALLNGHEIIDSQNAPLDGERPKELFTRHWGRATIRLPNGDPLIMHSAHLYPTADPANRSREIRAMITSMKADLDAGRSMLLIGDLNHGPDTEEYKL